MNRISRIILPLTLLGLALAPPTSAVEPEPQGKAPSLPHQTPEVKTLPLSATSPKAEAPADEGTAPDPLLDLSVISNAGEEAKPKQTQQAEPSLAPLETSLKNISERERAATAAGELKLVGRLTKLRGLLGDLMVSLKAAAEAERQASAAEQLSLELTAKTERARHLVEQTEARGARALARLSELEKAAIAAKNTAKPNPSPAPKAAPNPSPAVTH